MGDAGIGVFGVITGMLLIAAGIVGRKGRTPTIVVGLVWAFGVALLAGGGYILDVLRVCDRDPFPGCIDSLIGVFGLVPLAFVVTWILASVGISWGRKRRANRTEGGDTPKGSRRHPSMAREATPRDNRSQPEL